SSCSYSGAQLQSFLAGNLPADAPVFFTTGGVFGRLAIPGNLTYAQPGTGGASLAAALLFSGSGFAIKNYVTDFDAATGASMPGFAQQIQGLDFLGSPIVADVSGDGQPDLVVGADSSALMAYQAGGVMPGGFPKFTSGWAVWAPSSGDLLSDGQTDIVQLTREGYVFAWRTDGTYAGDQEWWAGHHDEWRTGRYGVDSRPPGAIRNARLSGSKLTFTAPGGDWYDGQAAGYRVSFSSQTVPATVPAGSPQSITVPAGVTSFTIQAVDRAGNLGPALTVSRTGSGHGGWAAEQVEVPADVEDLVAHELVGEAERRVHDALLAHQDAVVQPPAVGEAHLLELLDFLDEAEGARRGDLAAERLEIGEAERVLLA